MTRACISVTFAALATLASCATADDTTDDGEAEDAAALDHDGADVAGLVGLYRWADADRPYWANDIPSLELAAESYVRSRCYGWDCASLIPQTGAVEWVRTSAHKTYLRFMSFVKVESGEEWIEEPVVGDVYEIKATTGGIKLRKTYSSHWMTLAEVTPTEACEASGGAWADDACACPELPGSDWSHYIGFFSGLGGCFEITASNEDGCDSTHGSYLDDDASPIGTYCLCPISTHETTAGCVPLGS